jgi:hypothetical protein
MAGNELALNEALRCIETLVCNMCIPVWLVSLGICFHIAVDILRPLNIEKVNRLQGLTGTIFESSTK